MLKKGHLFKRLRALKKRGVKIKLKGEPSSPLEVMGRLKIKNLNTLMPHFVYDERGRLRELNYVI